MLVERRAGLRAAGLEIRFVLAFREWFPLKEGYYLLEDGTVARGFHVLNHGIRKPKRVIGNARANSAASGWMPPMLHITLQKLPRCGPADMVACDGALWN